MIKYKIDIFLWKKMFQLNRVYVIFDQPTAVSMIKIWNYSKTANRGAKDIAVSLEQAVYIVFIIIYNTRIWCKEFFENYQMSNL